MQMLLIVGTWTLLILGVFSLVRMASGPKQTVACFYAVFLGAIFALLAPVSFDSNTWKLDTQAQSSNKQGSDTKVKASAKKAPKPVAFRAMSKHTA